MKNNGHVTKRTTRRGPGTQIVRGAQGKGQERNTSSGRDNRICNCADHLSQSKLKPKGEAEGLIPVKVYSKTESHTRQTN